MKWGIVVFTITKYVCSSHCILPWCFDTHGSKYYVIGISEVGTGYSCLCMVSILSANLYKQNIDIRSISRASMCHMFCMIVISCAKLSFKINLHIRKHLQVCIQIMQNIIIVTYIYIYISLICIALFHINPFSAYLYFNKAHLLMGSTSVIIFHSPFKSDGNHFTTCRILVIHSHQVLKNRVCKIFFKLFMLLLEWQQNKIPMEPWLSG